MFLGHWAHFRYRENLFTFRVRYKPAIIEHGNETIFRIFREKLVNKAGRTLFDRGYRLPYETYVQVSLAVGLHVMSGWYIIFLTSVLDCCGHSLRSGFAVASSATNLVVLPFGETHSKEAPKTKALYICIICGDNMYMVSHCFMYMFPKESCITRLHWSCCIYSNYSVPAYSCVCCGCTSTWYIASQLR